MEIFHLWSVTQGFQTTIAKGFLVWGDSKERCVHYNEPIVPTFGRHSCVARATAICTLHIVESFRSYSTINKYSISFPRNQKQQCRNRPQKIYDRYTFDKSAEKIDGRVFVFSPHVKACDFLGFVEYFFLKLPVARAKQLFKTTSCKKATELPG